ncbi:MAG: hypothetical protein EOP06_23700 [Proteobacteria bacterium]|nr:MAG: hypothetical protein EOP06_23700 [Pseudomonadota bacterium]
MKSSIRTSLSSPLFLIVLGFGSLTLAAEANQTREQFHQAFEQCITENGLTRPEPGTRPSEEDRTKLDTCLTAKGITQRPRPRHERKEAFEECDKNKSSEQN